MPMLTIRPGGHSLSNWGSRRFILKSCAMPHAVARRIETPRLKIQTNSLGLLLTAFPEAVSPQQSRDRRPRRPNLCARLQPAEVHDAALITTCAECTREDFTSSPGSIVRQPESLPINVVEDCWRCRPTPPLPKEINQLGLRPAHSASLPVKATDGPINVTS